MSKILVFNAPAGSGKDVAVDLLVSKRGAIKFSFKNRLKNITLAIYGISEPLWNSWYTREGKEQPRNELDGLSCRQALINVSENVIKKNFGNEFFGRAEAQALSVIFSYDDPSYVRGAACSDGGFNDEITPLVDEFGEENVYIIRIYRDGYTFEGDSRDWITSRKVPDSNYITIANNSTLEDFHQNVLDAYDYVMSL